ncbi:MAG TPA: phospholipase D-like domain-containing protein [Allosphingosinicella sp.]|nr:phospholipase D-like domain-containing protein [Allosphingosinicella sp.]
MDAGRLGAPPLGRVEFGGPDLPPRHLRNLLLSCVEQSPPGSRIDWATYYFRDRGLAASLIRASDRGVKVRLVMEASPRRSGANDEVIAMLGSHGLGGGLHLSRSGWWSPGHLHAKIYAFSHPAIAWIGSFNPSGDDPEDPEVIAEIGDQDRGHNLLLGVEEPELVNALRDHVGALATSWSSLADRLRPSFNQAPSAPGNQLFFYPRLRTLLVEPEIGRLAGGDLVQGAISHLKPGPLTAALARAARRGAQIDLLVHDTERRVPSRLVGALSDQGVRIRRVRHPEGLPMHSKFLLIDRSGITAGWLGSYNYNWRSRYLNAELLLRSTSTDVVQPLRERFERIAALAG